MKQFKKKFLSGSLIIFSLSLLINLFFTEKSLLASDESKKFKDCEICPEMLVIPPGEFQMGSELTEEVLGLTRTEGPVHKRIISKRFAVGIFEVSNKEFKSFIDSTNYRPSQSCTKWKGKVIQFDGNWLDPDYGREPKDNEPVVCVSWYDAKAYTVWLSGITHQKYRLLSEAEWEYIAKNNNNYKWAWGDKASDACKYSNVFDIDGKKSNYAEKFATWDPTNCLDGFERVAPVGSFSPNKFGVYDITGNVWEWMEDCSEAEYKNGQLDEKPNQVRGHCEKRSVKGGSWLSKISRHRPSFRGRDPENLSSHIFGFRIAKDL